MVLEECSANALDHQKDEQVDPRANMPGTLLEAEMTKLQLSYFVHILRRLGSLEKATILRKIEGKDDKQEKRNTTCEVD